MSNNDYEKQIPPGGLEREVPKIPVERPILPDLGYNKVPEPTANEDKRWSVIDTTSTIRKGIDSYSNPRPSDNDD